MEKSYFWWFCWLGLGNPCHIATKTPLEKLHQNLGLADPHPPQLGQKTKFFDRSNLRAPLSEEETWHCRNNSFLCFLWTGDQKSHFSSVPLSSIIMANDHCLYWSQWFHYNFPGPPFNLQFLWNLKAMEKGLPDHQKWDYKVTAEKSKNVHIWESL